MPMQHDCLSRPGNSQIWAILGKQFLERTDRAGDCIGLRAVKQCRHLIPQRQSTGRLQPDNRNARSNKRVQSGHKTLRLSAGTINHASRQIGPPTTEWPPVFGNRGKYIIASCRKDAAGCAQILRLKIAIERIGKQNNRLSITPRRVSNIARTKRLGLPFRQGAAGGKTGNPRHKGSKKRHMPPNGLQ